MYSPIRHDRVSTLPNVGKPVNQTAVRRLFLAHPPYPTETDLCLAWFLCSYCQSWIALYYLDTFN